MKADTTVVRFWRLFWHSYLSLLSLFLPVLLTFLFLSVSPLLSQTCPQSMTLRQETCPSTSPTSCTTGGSSTGGTLSWQQLDYDLMNTVALCNGPGRYTWPAPSSGYLKSNGSGTVTIDATNYVPTSRTVTCTAPLLCNGSTSMDLSANDTLSIASFYIPLVGTGFTPVSGASAPVRELTTGSTVTSALASGLRTATFRLFDTNASDVDNALFAIDVIQSSNPGAATIKKTGLAISIYSMPDNGGDSSGLLIAQSGGGNGASIFKAHELRPFGSTDYGSAIDGALEVGTSDQSFAINAEAGLQSWCSYPGNSCPNTNIATAVWARVFNAGSNAILMEPADHVYDSRVAWAIGTHQVNAAPTNVTAKALFDGSLYTFNGTNSWNVTSAGVRIANDTSDATAPTITFRKSRGNGQVNVGEDIGDIAYRFVNTSSAEVSTGFIRGVAADRTAGSEDMDLGIFLAQNGTVGQKYTFTSTGNFTAVGSLAGSNLSGTNTGDQTITLTGDVTGSGTGSFATTLSGSYKGWTDSGTTVNTTTGTDKVGIGTSSADSPLHITTNAAALPSPISGTLLHVGQVDSGTGAVFASDTFGAANTFACRRADNTNASPSALAANDVICNFAAYGYGTSAYGATPGAAIKLTADQAWTTTAQGGRIDLATADLNTAAGTTVKWSISAMGHLTSTQTTAPTVACTGTGTSPSAPTIDSGGTDHKWTVTMNTGTGSPGSTGTCTVTFATAFPAARPIVCMLVKGASAWGNGSTIMETTESASAPIFTWTNIVNGTPTTLTISTSYKFSCIGGL